jgi:Transposase IS116/IS110/IS902 family
MTTPGVGPVVALTYRATVDVPARFRKSKAVEAVFGLTCSKYQSGEIDWSGRISRCGDEMMRAMLDEAAQSMLVRSTRWSWLGAPNSAGPGNKPRQQHESRSISDQRARHDGKSGIRLHSRRSSHFDI